jgi:hypothetical protein
MVKSSKPPKLSIVNDTRPKKLKEKNVGVNPDQESYHYHKGAIMRQLAKVEAEKKVLKAARRAAQDAGLVLEDVDYAIKNKDKEPETIQANVARRIQYMAWDGLAPGTQADLFKMPSARNEIEIAEQEGYIAGLEGESAIGDRYDSGNPIGQARLKGHARGQTVLHDRFLSKNEAAATE